MAGCDVSAAAAAGILEQGSRLQEVVSQLQAALHPSAATTAVPPALQQASSKGSGPGRGPGAARRPALPGTSRGGAGGASGSSGSSSGSGGLPSSGQWQLAESPSRPALPSSSIGSDYQLGSTIDLSVDEPASAGVTQPPSSSSSGGSSSSANSSSSGGDGSSSSSNGGAKGSNGSDGGSSSGGTGAALVYGSRASADLLNVLMPLLASASNFAAVSGINFVMAQDGGRSHSHGSGGDSGDGHAASGPAPQQQEEEPAQALALPAAEVAVGPGKLKRMLSQLIDGLIACATRGDLVQASVHPQQWQGRPGVAVSLCCCYSLLHGGGGGGGSGGGSLPRPPLQPEFAFLQGTACEAGGWFEVQADATPDVAHLNSSALTATLWLPTAPTS